MTRLKLKFPVLALCALCVVISGCGSEADSGNKPNPIFTGGTGAVGGTSAGTGGVSGTTAGTSGVSGTTAGTGGVSGTTAGTGGTAGDVGLSGGVSGGMGPAGEGGMGPAGEGGMGPAGAGGTGAGGTGGGDAEACIADFLAAGDTMDCAQCACSMCLTELGMCTEDTNPAPNPTVSKTSGEVCQEIIECAGANNCSGDACWCGCTSGPGCCDQQYMMMGPCKFEINQGGSMMDFLGGGIAGPGQMYYPSPDDKNPGPGHPIGNANVVGACIADKCAACQ